MTIEYKPSDNQGASEDKTSQRGLLDLLADEWESQERGQIIDLPRWAQ